MNIMGDVAYLSLVILQMLSHVDHLRDQRTPTLFSVMVRHSVQVKIFI